MKNLFYVVKFGAIKPTQIHSGSVRDDCFALRMSEGR